MCAFKSVSSIENIQFVIVDFKANDLRFPRRVLLFLLTQTFLILQVTINVLVFAGNLQNATVFSNVAVAVQGSSDIVEIRHTNDTQQNYEVLVNKFPIDSRPASTSQYRSKRKTLLSFSETGLLFNRIYLYVPSSVVYIYTRCHFIIITVHHNMITEKYS